MPSPEMSRTALVNGGRIFLTCLFAGSELKPAAGAPAVRPAGLFLVRRMQVLSSAQARFVSGA